MSCREYRAGLHEKLRGNLSAEKTAELKAHAETCPDCRDFKAVCQELTCKEFVDFLHAYIDHELSEERTLVFDRHLTVCPDCTAYLDGYRRTMNLSVTAMTGLSEKLPAKIPEDLVRAVLDARQQGD